MQRAQSLNEDHTPLCYFLMLAGACLFGITIWALALYGVMRWVRG